MGRRVVGLATLHCAVLCRRPSPTRGTTPVRCSTARKHSDGPRKKRTDTHVRIIAGRDEDALQATALLYHDGRAALQDAGYHEAGAKLMAACGARGASADEQTTDLQDARSLAEVKQLLADGADPNYVHDASNRAGVKGRLTPLLAAIEAGTTSRVCMAS